MTITLEDLIFRIMRAYQNTVLCIVLFTTLVLCASSGRANNIQVANATLTGNTGTSALIQFDLSWENSWRGGGVANWDAAWVFVKFRTSTIGAWQHLKLSNIGHSAPAGSQIDLGLQTPGGTYNISGNPVLGVFVYRNASGTGNLSLTNVQLQCDYVAQGLSYNDLFQIQVFAIEMVYVPEGAFFVGSGGTEFGSFTDGAWSSGATIPRQITSEAMITIGQIAGLLWGTSSTGNSTIGPAGQLPATYPKGHAAFYCMKYELSQQGYVDFLNTLTYTQQLTRTATAPNSAAGTGALSSTNANRNGIDIETPGVASTTPAVYACNLDGDAVFGEPLDGKDVACNFLSWGDLSAYLDWSGLRPMTELEFEKACRGTLAPVPNEFAWGTSSIASSAYTLANARANNEGIATNYSTTAGNASYSATDGANDGPLRVGIFAANGSNSGRMTAGASYYGIMELSGNLFERPVTVGNANGRSFLGSHGNGTLSSSGDPDGAAWPAPTTADGAGLRGGGWTFAPADAQVSNRSSAATTTADSRFNYAGGRGVRRAP